MGNAQVEGMEDDGSEPQPIGAHLDAVASDPELPYYDIAACAARIEEAAPALRAIVSRAADGGIETEQEAIFFFRALHILAAARDPETFQPLIRLLRRDPEEADWLLGDVAINGLSPIVAGLFDGDAESLFAAITDESLDDFVRGSLMEAAAFLAWEGRIARDRLREFLLRFDTDRAAVAGEYVWISWAIAIAILGFDDLAPLAARAWDDERIEEIEFDKGDFDKLLADALARPDDVERLHAEGLGYIEDAIGALSRFGSYDDEASGAPEYDSESGDAHWEPAEPAINPHRNVGRNDPCPCGSGKKAKKCCLAS